MKSLNGEISCPFLWDWDDTFIEPVKISASKFNKNRQIVNVHCRAGKTRNLGYYFFNIFFFFF